MSTYWNPIGGLTNAALSGTIEEAIHKLEVLADRISGKVVTEILPAAAERAGFLIGRGGAEGERVGIQLLQKLTDDVIPAAAERANFLIGQGGAEGERVAMQLLHELERSVGRIIENIPGQVLGGAKMAAYQEAAGLFLHVLNKVIEGIPRDTEERHYGMAREKLEQAKAALESSLREPGNLLRDLPISYRAFQESNLHIFGVSFRPLDAQTTVTVSALNLKGIPEAPPASCQDLDFNQQRGILITSMKRIALVQLVYKLIIGKASANFITIHKENMNFELIHDPLEWRRQEKAFENAIFSQIKIDLGDQSTLVRWFSYLASCAVYTAASWVMAPFIENAMNYGLTSMTAAIDALKETKNAARVHDHLFKELGLYLQALHGSYEELSKAKLPKTLDVDASILREFEEDKDLHLGRTSEEFNRLVNRFIMEKTLERSALNRWYLYPLRQVILAFFSRIKIVDLIFDMVEKAKTDDQGFQYALDKMVTSIFLKLLAALNQEGEGPLPIEEISSGARKVIEIFIKSLFDAIALENIQTKKELRDYFADSSSVGKQWDEFKDKEILLGAVMGSANALSHALKNLLTEDFLKQMMNDSLKLLNEAYVDEAEITDEMKVEAQKERKLVLDHVLNVSIEKGLSMVPALNKEQEVRLANDAITQLRRDVLEFQQALSLGAEERGEERVSLNDLWNSFVLKIKRSEEQIKGDARIGGVIAEEISSRYYNRIATILNSLNPHEIDLDALESLDLIRSCLRLLDEAVSQNCLANFLDYNPVGHGTGFAFIKSGVLGTLRSKVNGLFSLAFKPATLRYGVFNGLIARPLLLKSGIKDLSRAR